jgi:hypothetical protein
MNSGYFPIVQRLPPLLIMPPEKPAKRPNNGCWTCKLRRKKCDERLLPSCATCERFGIVCHRSKTKPDFMKDGEKGRQLLIEINAIVKVKNDSLRRSRALEVIHRKQYQSQEVERLFQNITSEPKTTSRPEILQTLPFAVSNPSVSSDLYFLPSKLNKWDNKISAYNPASCEQWVKDHIDEVDALNMEKYGPSPCPTDTEDFRSKVKRIWIHLEEGCEDAQRRYIALTAKEPDRRLQPSEFEAYSRKVDSFSLTCLFNFGALIYLHITLHGTDPGARFTANKMVFEWIFAYRFIPDNRLLSNAVWAFCVTGSLATTVSDRKFFRETVTTSDIDRSSPCKIWQALDIMEKCWNKSRDDSMQPGDLNWLRAVDELR